jgi:hypothetical protein
MSTQHPTADTHAPTTQTNQPTARTEDRGAPMMFATDNEVEIRGLFEAESNDRQH